MPKRLQRSRREGWRMPAGAVYVGRPTKWGNPFPVSGDWIVWAAVAAGYKADAEGRRAAAIAHHKAWLLGATLEMGPMAGTKTGDAITYESGLCIDRGTAARGLAASFADMTMLAGGSVTVPFPPTMAELEAALRGKDLVCWCPLDQPCHADALLEIANGGDG